MPIRFSKDKNVQRTSRREFIDRTARATVALGLSSSAACSRAPEAGGGSDSSMIPIVDTHQHLWDLEKFRPPWLSSAPPVLARSYVTKDYLEATEGLEVVKAVYMEVDVDPRQQIEEAEHVIELSRSSEHPTVAAVVSGRPASRAFRGHINRFMGNEYIKGVRQVLHVPETPRGLCLHEQFIQSVRHLGELGMSFDICMRPTELADGVRLATHCPDTLIIVDHCGNADPKAFLGGDRAGEEAPWHKVEPWKRDMGEFAKLSNVVCKISGIVARAPGDDWSAEDLAPIVNFCLDTFGPDRVVFGGDWPVCRLVASYREWVEALKQIISSRPVEEQRKVLHDNAVRLYKLG